MSMWTWLRDKFAIFFIIGLAFSVLSFVEGLHMGRAAIDFLVQRISEITGWPEFFRAIVTTMHAVFEWWRDIVRDLLGIFGITIPEWLHDPLSVLFFALSRGITSAIGRVQNDMDNSLNVPGFHRGLSYANATIFGARLAGLMTMVMANLILIDLTYWSSEKVNLLAAFLPYFLILVLFFLCVWIAVSRRQRLTVPGEQEVANNQ